MNLFAHLPTESLAYTVATQVATNAPVTSVASTTRTVEPVVPKRPAPSGYIDPEMATRILDYIYRKKGSVRTNSTAKPRPIASRTKELVNLPTSSVAPQRSASLIDTALDSASDLLGLRSQRNAAQLTLDVLVQNKVWVRKLLTKCKVSMTDVWNAGLCSTLHDLLRLEFTLEDLRRDPTLFTVNHLSQFFDVHYDDLRQAGVQCDAFTMRVFTATELETMQFSFATLLQDFPDCTASKLCQFKLPLRYMTQMGFEPRHAKQLGIGRTLALAAQPRGFAWDPEEWAPFETRLLAL